MKLRPFKEDSEMDIADFVLQAVLEATNGLDYRDLNAQQRRTACLILRDVSRSAYKVGARALRRKALTEAEGAKYQWSPFGHPIYVKNSSSYRIAKALRRKAKRKPLTNKGSR